LQREPDEPIDKEEILLKKQLHGLEETYQELDNDYNNLSTEHNKTEDINSRRILGEKIKEITSERNATSELIDQCNSELSKKNLQKYNHPVNVFCPIDTLTNFFNLHNTHLDDKLQKI